MSKRVDNFDLIRSKMTFIDQFDRYVCHVMRRVKDAENAKLKSCGSNESQRLLRTYYFGDLDYFDRKISAIKELCDTTNARAYILPQVRNNRDCLINLGKLVFENLDNPTIKLDGITRKAVCSCHTSRDKKWILDFDDWSLDFFDTILEDVKKNLDDIGKNPDKDLYVVPTRHGKHIVTSPFNTKLLNEHHPLVFEGEKIGFDIDALSKVVGPDILENSMFDIQMKNFTPDIKDKLKTVPLKKHVGILHKDGATLLYAPGDEQ